MPIKNQDLLRKTEKTGLTDKESLVYLSLLELGGGFPSKIAEYAGLNRSTVYKILLELNIRGVVSEIKKRNKLFYQIENPNKLIRYTKGRLSIVQDEISQTERLIPELEGLYKGLEGKPGIKYFENIEGLLAIYEDMVINTSRYEMLAFSNAATLGHILPKNFFEDFRRTKEKIGITTRGIIPDTHEDRNYNTKFFEGFRPEIVPVMRFIPKEDFPFKGEITIYGANKVAIVNLNKEYLTGLIIEDETIHNMMKMIFEFSWKGIAK